MSDSQKTSGAKAHLWKPGKSMNPGGRPKGSKLLREAVRALTPEAIEALKEGLQATKLVGMTLQEVPDHPTRIHAAQVVMDRGYGKPVAETELPEEEDDLSQYSNDELREMAEKVLKGN